MSRTELRLLAAIGAVALALRVGVACLTQSHPLFPAFYYTDAQVMNEGAAEADAARLAGKPYLYPGIAGLSQRMQVSLQAGLYRFVGPRPIAAKLVIAVLGSLSIVVLGFGLAEVFSAEPALAAAAAAALWPSHVFYTSQNFKEAPTNLLAYLGLACGLMLLGGTPARRSPLLAALTMIFLVGAGFYRSYILLTICVALALAFAWALSARRARPLWFGLAAVLAAPAIYIPISHYVLEHWLTAHGLASDGDQRLEPRLIPVTIDDQDFKVSHSPTSPEGLTEFRRSRQYSDRHWAALYRQREIGTQLFPDARFKTWLDVLAFVPKGGFYVLFMPLPGLYPIDGKLGRLFAALENSVLLGLAFLGLTGAVRGPKTPARAALLLFFLAMTAGCALLEFDLGSATRHKLLYLPMLFPFAAEEFFRLIGRKEPS